MMDKPDTGAWNSIDDALKTFYSFSKVTKGSGPKSGDNLMSNQPVGNVEMGCPGSSHNRSRNTSNLMNKISHNGNTSDEDTNETLLFEGGRGRYLKNLQKQYARQELDETIHNELKMIFGTGFSNEAIENYFESVTSSSATTQETGVFSDAEDNQQEVEIVLDKSNTMKKVTANEKLSAGMLKKKSPRCRNAIVLSLTQKKNPNEPEEDTKRAPELKGPDLFLPNKSYSTVVSAASRSNINQAAGPIFGEEDFPAL